MDIEGSCGRGWVGVELEDSEEVGLRDGRMPTARREASEAGRRDARELMI